MRDQVSEIGLQGLGLTGFGVQGLEESGFGVFRAQGSEFRARGLGFFRAYRVYSVWK